MSHMALYSAYQETLLWRDEAASFMRMMITTYMYAQITVPLTAPHKAFRNDIIENRIMKAKDCFHGLMQG